MIIGDNGGGGLVNEETSKGGAAVCNQNEGPKRFERKGEA